jgi:uncharacterized protein
MSSTAGQEVATPVKAGVSGFVWHELRTTDAPGAADFYAHVVGWQVKDSGDPGGIPYKLLSTGGLHTAGLMQLSPEMLAGGMRPAWVGFIGVDDVDAYAARVEQAGGKLHCPAQDIPTIGRFASVEDPQGAVFLLFKGSRDVAQPRLPVTSPAAVGWNELSANDGPAAWSFYSNLFGWTEDSVMDMGPMGIYRIFATGGPRAGGMMTRDPKTAPQPFWLYYFNVNDIDAAVERIKAKNGKLVMGPHEVPGNMWIVVGVDPQGANFALVGFKKK